MTRLRDFGNSEVKTQRLQRRCRAWLPALGLWACDIGVVSLERDATCVESGEPSAGGASPSGPSPGEQTGVMGGASMQSRGGLGGATINDSSTIGTTTTAVGATAPPCWEFEPAASNRWRVTYGNAWDLGDRTLRDEAAAAALLDNTLVDVDADYGYGGIAGSAKLTIPFAPTQSDFQGIQFANVLDVPLDLTNRILKAQVRLDSGMTGADLQNPSGATIYVKTGAHYVYAGSDWVNLSLNEWIEVSLDTRTPGLLVTDDGAPYEPFDVREIGIDIDTGGGTNVVMTPGVVHIDHICVK